MLHEHTYEGDLLQVGVRLLKRKDLLHQAPPTPARSRAAKVLQLIAEFAAHSRTMPPKGVICCACCPHAAVQAGTAQCNGASLTVCTLLCFAALRCSLRTCRCPGTSAAGCSTLTPQSAGRALLPPPAAPVSAALK